MPDVELGIQNPSAASVPQAQQHHVAPKRSVMAAAKALAVKNLIFQKRNICGTITLILVPLLLLTALWAMQKFVIDKLLLDLPVNRCGCLCTQLKDVPNPTIPVPGTCPGTTYTVLKVTINPATAKAKTDGPLMIKDRKLGICQDSQSCDSAAGADVVVLAPVDANFLTRYVTAGNLDWDSKTEPSIKSVKVTNITTKCNAIEEDGAFRGWSCPGTWTDTEAGCMADGFNGPCGKKYSTPEQANWCAIEHPMTAPAWLTLPKPMYRGVAAAAGWTDTARVSKCLGLTNEECTAMFPYTGEDDFEILKIVEGMFPTTDGQDTSNPRVPSDITAPFMSMMSMFTPGQSTSDMFAMRSMIEDGLIVLGNSTTLAVYNGFEAGLNANYYAEPASAPGSSSLFGGSVTVMNAAGRCPAPSAGSMPFGPVSMPKCVPTAMTKVAGSSKLYELLFNGHGRSDKAWDNTTNKRPMFLNWVEKVPGRLGYRELCATVLPDPEARYTQLINDAAGLPSGFLSCFTTAGTDVTKFCACDWTGFGAWYAKARQSTDATVVAAVKALGNDIASVQSNVKQQCKVDISNAAPNAPASPNAPPTMGCSGGRPGGRRMHQNAPKSTKRTDGIPDEDICLASFAAFKTAASADPVPVHNVLRFSEYGGAFDFKSSSVSKKRLDLQVLYNDTNTYRPGRQGPGFELRINKLMNMVSDAFLRAQAKAKGVPDVSVILTGLRETPKPPSKLALDFASILGPLFYTWVLLLPISTFTSTVVYEKEKKLRMMMKMQGLQVVSYLLINIVYMITIMVLYCVFFVGIGSAYGLKFFTGNDYGVHVVFFLLLSLQQVTFSLLLSSIFSSARTAQVFSGLWVIAGGLLGNSLLDPFIKSETKGETYCALLEFFFPFFALYRGLFEMGEAAFVGTYSNQPGLMFEASRMDGGMGNVMIILACQIVLYSILYTYLEQVIDSGAGVPKHPLFFLGIQPAGISPKDLNQDSDKAKSGRNPDVIKEEEETRKLDKNDPTTAILIRGLRKIFPGRGGGEKKIACHSLSLAVKYGECFGLLGPNGAGKSTSINMLVGFLAPTDGDAYVCGKSIRYELPEIYSHMGLCPQHDLLWETLTSREHLTFYGRLKGLEGKPLEQAVDKALKDVNLYEVGDKQAGQYSGGMKRRLSVAISLIGDPKVVYMDEPSTGLDPSARQNLWRVIKEARVGRAIILTTHSMEEADELCSRLGIFVDGEMKVIGEPKELIRNYGHYIILTMTTSLETKAEATEFVKSLVPTARPTRDIEGTQRFELPTKDVQLDRIFAAMLDNKSRLQVVDWSVSNATLEDVFMQVASSAAAFD